MWTNSVISSCIVAIVAEDLVVIREMANRGLLPTPAAMDVKGANSMAHLNQENGNTVSHMGQLPNYIMYHTTQDGKSSQLNPRFVMEMMGFPPDHTQKPFMKQQIWIEII